MDVVLQWGPERGVPEADRMRKVHTSLNDEEIQEARSVAYSVLNEAMNEIAFSLKNETISRDEAIVKLRSTWAWLTDEQARKAIGQGEYYHWRENG